MKNQQFTKSRLATVLLALICLFSLHSCNNDDDLILDGITTDQIIELSLVQGQQEFPISSGNGGYYLDSPTDEKIVKVEITNNKLILTPIAVGTVKVLLRDKEGKTLNFSVTVKEALDLELATSNTAVRVSTTKFIQIVSGNGNYTITRDATNNKDGQIATAEVTSGTNESGVATKSIRIMGTKAGITTFTITDEAKKTTTLTVEVFSAKAIIKGTSWTAAIEDNFSVKVATSMPVATLAIEEDVKTLNLVNIFRNSTYIFPEDLTIFSITSLDEDNSKINIVNGTYVIDGGNLILSDFYVYQNQILDAKSQKQVEAILGETITINLDELNSTSTFNFPLNLVSLYDAEKLEALATAKNEPSIATAKVETVAGNLILNKQEEE